MSTAQLLVSTGYPCLKRHSVTGDYYGVKKHEGKIKQIKLRMESGAAISDRKLAEKAVRKWVDELEEGKKTVPRTLAEHFDVFCQANGVPTLAEVAKHEKENEGKKGNDRKRPITPRKKKNLIWALRKIAEYWKKNLDAPISTVRTSEVQAFLNSHRDEFKAASFNELSRQVKNVFQLAVADGAISTNPYEAIDKKQKRRRVKREQDKIPSLEEFENLIATIRKQHCRFEDSNDWAADLAQFLGLAALGEAEANDLRWQNVDFENKELRIRRVKTGEYFTVPMYDYLETFLVAFFEKQGKPTGEKKVFKTATCAKALESACKELKLPHFSPRSLRKMGITRLLRAGMNVKLVAKWQGHQDGGKLILDTYSDVISAGDRDFEQAELAKLKNTGKNEPKKDVVVKG